MKQSNKRIGLSFCNCVMDIATGNVDIKDVQKVITSTRCEGSDEWQKVIEVYKDNDWLDHPEEAERIAWELIEDGRTEQPRLIEVTRFPFWPQTGIWVNDEMEIVWNIQTHFLRF